MKAKAGSLACGLALLFAGNAAAAQGPPNQSPPNPDPLWRNFPLEPAVTTPAAEPPSTRPVRPPADPGAAPAASSGPETPWTPLMFGVVAGLLVLTVVVTQLARRRQLRPAAVAVRGASPYALIEEALAREAAESYKFVHYPPSEGVAPVSKNPDQVSENPEVASATEPAPQTAAAPSTSVPSTYAEIGERVASVLSAAEEAAKRIRADARGAAEELVDRARQEAERLRGEAERIQGEATAYDTDTRAAVESYAKQRRREAEQQEQKLLADAEGQARATREAAEEMARRIEEAARQRGQVLREEFRSVEERLQRALQGLRRMTAQLEELLGVDLAGEQSLTDALQPAGRQAGSDAGPDAVPDAGPDAEPVAEEATTPLVERG